MRVGPFIFRVSRSRAAPGGSHPPEAFGRLDFQCNLCGKPSSVAVDQLDRETVSCGSCGSTLRFRALINSLSRELYGEELALEQFPPRPELRGLGMTDWTGYAEPLSRLFSYRNTFLHQSPKFDLLDPSPEDIGGYDLVITSDVMEHVPAPIQRGFDNLFSILAPGGLVVLTVPFTDNDDNLEHYDRYASIRYQRDGKRTIRVFGTTPYGIEEEIPSPVFHGGDGDTLEMRLFSRRGLIDNLNRAGFQHIRVHDDPCFKFGIYFRYPWSVPITARRPG